MNFVTVTKEQFFATESQIDDYMTLALHVVQGLKKLGDE